MVFSHADLSLLARHDSAAPSPDAWFLNVLLEVMSHPGVRCEERALVLRTLELWAEHPGLHFVDCHLVAAAGQAGEAVATLDDGIARAGLVPVIDGAA